MKRDEDARRSGSTVPVSPFPPTAPSVSTLALHVIAVFSIVTAIRFIYPETSANYGLMVGTTAVAVLLYTQAFSLLKNQYR